MVNGDDAATAAGRTALPWLVKPLLGLVAVAFFAFALVRLRQRRPAASAVNRPPREKEPAPTAAAAAAAKVDDAVVADAAATTEAAAVAVDEHGDELAALSMKQLRAIVVQGGGSLDGLLERRELEERARQVRLAALAKADHASDNNDDDDDNAAEEELVAPTMTRKDVAKAEKRKRKAEMREWLQQEIQRKKETAENKKRLQEEDDAERDFFRKQRQRAPAPAPPPQQQQPKPVTDNDIGAFVIAQQPIALAAVLAAFPTAANVEQRVRKVAADVNAIIDQRDVIRVVQPLDLDALRDKVMREGCVNAQHLLDGLCAGTLVP